MTRRRVGERARDASVEVRAALVRELQALADVELEVEDDAEYDEYATEVLANAEAVLALIADPDASVRAGICRVLDELARDDPGDSDGWPFLHDLGVFARTAAAPLARAVRDPDPSVRAAALGALVRIAPQTFTEAMSALAEDSDPGVQAALVTALVDTGDRRSPELLVRHLRATGRRADPAHVRALPRYLLDGSEARAVLLPLLAEGVPDELRKVAAYALVEHVDGSCNPALAPLVVAGDHAALVALARLGTLADGTALRALLERAPSPQLLFTAGYAAAACERRECLPPLLGALGHSSPGTFGQFGNPRATIPWWLLGAISAFDDPRVFDAAAPLAIAPAGRTPPHSAHAENWEFHQRLFEVGTAALALGASGRPEGIGLIQAAAAQLAASDALDIRTRMRFALGVALIDPDALDPMLVESREPWFRRLYTFEQQVLPFAFALRLLGRRLRARTRPLTEMAKAFVAAALDFIATADVADGIDAYRGLASVHSADAAWIFLISDLLAEARRLLSDHVQVRS